MNFNLIGTKEGLREAASVFIDGMALPPDPKVAELLHDFIVNQARQSAETEKAHREQRFTDAEHQGMNESYIADLQNSKGV